MFGNDIQHTTIEGKDEFQAILHKFDALHQLRNFFSGKEVTYTKSGVLFDVSYDVPLSTGLPLSVRTYGASSIDLRMAGSLKEINLETKKIDIEGKLKPSISLDVIGTMQSDYFFGSSGIRVRCNLFSSSAVDAKLKVQGTHLASLQFSLPQDRNDILSARSELIVTKYDKDIVQTGIKNRYENSTCTWPFVDRAVGLKICAEYSVPDVNNRTQDYPSLLLSGPIHLDMHLDKADPTAKTFLFEYRWDKMGNESMGSFSFHTPNSLIPRIFSANITADPNNYNVSMSFQNGELAHSAVGTYRNVSNNRRLEVYLNLNGQRNFAIEVGLNQTEFQNGLIYYPIFILSVNNARIAGFDGAIKFTQKKNIIQWDVNLTFQTKRMQAQLTGHLLKSEVSYSTVMKVDYQFVGTKTETVEIEGEISNRNQKSRTECNGDLKLNSTAYPNFNFASNLTFLALDGHIETAINLNNAPNLVDDNYTLASRLKFIRFNMAEKKEGGTLLSVELARPVSNIDLKFMIQ